MNWSVIRSAASRITLGAVGIGLANMALQSQAGRVPQAWIGLYLNATAMGGALGLLVLFGWCVADAAKRADVKTAVAAGVLGGAGAVLVNVLWLAGLFALQAAWSR